MQRQNDGILEPFPIWDDVRTFDGKPWRNIVDVVSGGFPCQDISCAGKGKGIDGARSGLWKEMARIIGEVRPKYVFVENSPMLITRGLAVVLGDLAEMGYNARWCRLSAANIGAAHKRDRVWIMAHSPEERLLEFQIERRNLRSGSFNSEHKRVFMETLSQEDFAKISRDANEMANWVDRLKAIGNGQVPAVAALAWEILKGDQ
jgi:DNA (cytosine-5)-methyltransferase 1